MQKARNSSKETEGKKRTEKYVVFVEVLQNFSDLMRQSFVCSLFFLH